MSPLYPSFPRIFSKQGRFGFCRPICSFISASSSPVSSDMSAFPLNWAMECSEEAFLSLMAVQSQHPPKYFSTNKVPMATSKQAAHRATLYVCLIWPYGWYQDILAVFSSVSSHTWIVPHKNTARQQRCVIYYKAHSVYKETFSCWATMFKKTKQKLLLPGKQILVQTAFDFFLKKSSLVSKFWYDKLPIQAQGEKT